MGTLNCCCNACDLTLEDLPTFAKDDWTATSWTLTDTCCAYMYMYPDTCFGPTFADGGDIDVNTRDISIGTQSMVVLYNNDVLAGTQTEPPERLCPPCQTPFACKTSQGDYYTKIATRFGLLYEPWRILMRICYVEVQCGEDPPAMKYVLESRHDYIILPLFQKYIYQTTVASTVSGGCCTGSTSFSSIPDLPDTTDPDFWGYPSGFPACLDDTDPQYISFSRYKIYDELADILAGTLTFDNTDIPTCFIGGVLPDDSTDYCVGTTGVSDPVFDPGGASLNTEIDCTPDPVVSIDCSIKWLHPCNSLWYYVDPDTETITCSPFAPRPLFPDTICGPATYTIKGNNPLDPPACGTEFAATIPFSADAACLSEPTPPCVGSWVRFANGWVTYTLYTVDTFCSGGTYAEICIAAPSWTVGITW